MSDGKGGRGEPSQRVTDQGSLLNAHLFVKPIKKVDKCANAIIKHGLVGFSETDLVWDQHSILLRKGGDCRRPIRSASPKSVKQNHYRTAARLKVMNLRAKNRCVLIGNRRILGRYRFHRACNGRPSLR